MKTIIRWSLCLLSLTLALSAMGLARGESFGLASACPNLVAGSANLIYTSSVKAEFQLNLTNNGSTPLTLSRIALNWIRYSGGAGNGMRTDLMKLSNIVFWNGASTEDQESPTDSDSANDPGRTGRNIILNAGQTAQFVARFTNNPANLASRWSLNNFNGSELHFGACSIIYASGGPATPTSLPGATRTPTRTPTSPPGTTRTPTRTPPPGSTSIPSARLAVGIMGIPDDQLSLPLTWGGDTLEYHESIGGSTLQTLFNSVKALGGKLILRSGSAFQTANGSIDMALVTQMLHDTFDGTTLLGDPAFIGFYVIDEACHPTKWGNLTGTTMATLYQTVKAYDTRVPLLHNFGFMDCAQTRLTESGGAPIADVAGFTITYGKTVYETRIDSFLAAQSAIAASVKATAPDMSILPMIAIFQSNYPLPSESWVETVGLAVLADPIYDGLMYYPWKTPWWAVLSLDDVSATYQDEIQRVFDAAD